MASGQRNILLLLQEVYNAITLGSHPWFANCRGNAFVSTPATTVLAHLLPNTTTLRLDAYDLDATAEQITLLVHSAPTLP